jgi:hypothetical protein
VSPAEIGNVMLKYAAASVVLLLGFAAYAPPALAAPGNDDCVNCAPSTPYPSEEPARIRQEMDRRAPDTAAPASAVERAPYAGRSPDAPARECADCPPPRRYDNTEVIKTSRDVDQSRVINTETVVQVPPRTKEINKLIIRENETRNVGVIQHNHRIIEKETRYVKRAPVYRPAVRHYAPAHRVVQRVQTVLVPVVMQPVQNCGCPCTCGSNGAYAQAYAYAYGGGYAYGSGRGAVQQVLVPVNVPAGYGYR